MFDILFRNAKVIDGTGNPWFYGDVGVEGGTVAAVLPPGSTARARRVADVDGKALCPGFVDGHSHSELPLLAGEGMDCKIMQGVTTENLGLDGMSLAPIKDGDKADWKKHLSGLAGTLDVPWTWNSFAEYLDCLQAAKPPLNVSSYVGLGTVRLSVMGMADRPAEDHEIRAMRDLVARCMDEGARGISAGLIYPPSRYQSLEETVAVAKAAAAHGGIYDVHMRNEADAIAESVEEVIAISERSGIPAMITHFKIRGKKNWGRSAALIRRIDEARAAGIAVTAEANLPPELSLTDLELSIVIGNLLDNAIEGCRSAAGEKFLRLSLRMKGDMLYFYLLNSAGKKQKKVGSLFRTGKTGAHGFGLHRAEAIVKQHGGWVKYNSEDGAFTSEFLVPAAC